MKLWNWKMLIVTILVALSWMRVEAVPRYAVTDLGTASGSFSFSSAINDRGQVVGYSFTKDGYACGFIWDGVLKPLPGKPGQAFGVNDQGLTVGHAKSRAGRLEACVWDLQRHLRRYLGTLGGDFSYALAVNNRWQIVGGAAVKVGDWSIAHPFIWERGRLIDLSPGDGVGWAADINEVGQIVGNVDYEDGSGPKAMLWTKEKAFELGSGYANGINTWGKIVGYRVIGGGVEAMRWNMEWRFRTNIEETVLTSLGGQRAWACKINDSGNIVGGAELPSGELRGTIWDENGVVYDLNGLIEPSEWVVFYADDINNRGQIACRGWHRTLGVTHALLLTPIRPQKGR